MAGRLVHGGNGRVDLRSGGMVRDTTRGDNEITFPGAGSAEEIGIVVAPLSCEVCGILFGYGASNSVKRCSNHPIGRWR